MHVYKDFLSMCLKDKMHSQSPKVSLAYKINKGFLIFRV